MDDMMQKCVTIIWKLDISLFMDEASYYAVYEMNDDGGG